MTGIVISMFVPGNRNILDHVFEVLISGIHFSDCGKARLIVILALREKEEHLLTLCNESPFTLDWCFDNIDVEIINQSFHITMIVRILTQYCYQ